jgi:hypothetical protein
MDYQRVPAVAAQPDGRFVVVWNSYGQDGAKIGVFAQRFGDAAVLDVDGNGAITALTDGLLVLRFLFGFTGTTLTASATAPNCTRCDAAAIVPYLTGLGLVLDIDDDANHELKALTDGILVLRFLFGFTGSTLTTAAGDLDCMRCDATTIVPYLQTLI